MTPRVGAMLGVLMFVCSTSASFAQGTITGGVKGGITFADVDLSTSESEFEDEVEELNDFIGRRTGFAFGGFVDVPFSESVSFQPEFLYSRKVTGGERPFEEDFGAILSGRLELENKLDQIQIPLLGKFTLPGAGVRPFIVAGPGLAFTVRVREKQDVFDLELDGEPLTLTAEDREFLEDEGLIYDDDIKDDIKSFEASVIVGGGVQFGNGSIEIRYDHGLTDLNAEEDEDLAVKTRTFTILFGWSFQ